MKFTTFANTKISSRLSLVCLLTASNSRCFTINSFTPVAQSHFGHSQYSNNYAPASNQKIAPTTQLEMGKDNERARTEKNLEDMMGDDWKFVRAQLVAQERAEIKFEAENKKNPPQFRADEMERNDKDLGRQAHMANAFAGAIASIFSSNDNTNNHDKQNFDGIEGIGSTGASAFLIEDPFATEDEIMATTLAGSEAIQLNSHRWAHPISHIEPGCVLVANEKLGGIFHQTVVLIVDHHPNTGTTGIVINRPLPGDLQKIARETESNVDLSLKSAFSGASVTFGGPLMQEDYSILHGYGEVDGSKKVAPGVFVGGSREMLDAVRSNNFDPSEALFVKGHAAWVTSQLSREVLKGVWYLASVSPEIILRYAGAPTTKDDYHPDDMWSEILSCMGGGYAELAKTFSGQGDRRFRP